MKITYDKEIDALYIYFKKGKVRKTAKISDGFLADLDSNDDVLGLEILDASRKIGRVKKAPGIIIGNKILELPAFQSR